MLKLITQKDIDVVIIADGGCDSLMSSIEKELATPVEDMMTIYVVNEIEKKVFKMDTKR